MINHCGISEFDLNMNNNCTTGVQTFTSKKHILGRKKICVAMGYLLTKQLSEFYKFVMFLLIEALTEHWYFTFEIRFSSFYFI